MSKKIVTLLLSLTLTGNTYPDKKNSDDKKDKLHSIPLVAGEADKTEADSSPEIHTTASSSGSISLMPKKPGSPPSSEAGHIPLFNQLDLMDSSFTATGIAGLPVKTGSYDWLKLPGLNSPFYTGRISVLPVQELPVFMLTDQTTDPPETITQRFRKLSQTDQIAILRKVAYEYKKLTLKLRTAQQIQAAFEQLKDNNEDFVPRLASTLSTMKGRSEALDSFIDFVSKSDENTVKSPPENTSALPVERLDSSPSRRDPYMTLGDFRNLTGIEVRAGSCEASPCMIHATRVMSYLTSSHLLGRLLVTPAQAVFAAPLCPQISRVSMPPVTHKLHWLTEQIERMLLPGSEAEGGSYEGLPENLRLVFHLIDSDIVRVISFQPGRGARLATSRLEDQHLRGETTTLTLANPYENSIHGLTLPELATPSHAPGAPIVPVDTELHLTLNPENLSDVYTQLTQYGLMVLRPAWHTNSGVIDADWAKAFESRLNRMLINAIDNWLNGLEWIPDALNLQFNAAQNSASPKDASDTLPAYYFGNTPLPARTWVFTDDHSSWVFNDRGFYKNEYIADGHYRDVSISTGAGKSQVSATYEAELLETIRNVFVESKAVPATFKGLCVVFRFRDSDAVRVFTFNPSGVEFNLQTVEKSGSVSLFNRYKDRNTTFKVTITFSDHETLRFILFKVIDLKRAIEMEVMKIGYETINPSDFASIKQVREFFDEYVARWGESNDQQN